jgi:hypothetical protein
MCLSNRMYLLGIDKAGQLGSFTLHLAYIQVEYFGACNVETCGLLADS